MNTNKKIVAIAAALALGMSMTASADDGDSLENPQLEKCYGISNAGMNDCASNAHGCAGKGSMDAGSGDWIFLPAGTCQKIYGGHTE
jgi:uncharacterized membrane protein